MSASSHERYRDVLSALVSDTALLPVVGQAGERCRWWTADRTWQRTYSRFMPDSASFATFAFASERPSHEICRVEVFQRAPDEHGRTRDWCHVETEYGCARVTRFPFDPGLPGLAIVAAGATVIRYRPNRRCTLRTAAGGRTVFAKVYRTDTGARVFRDLVALRRAALNGGLQLAIAEPLAWEAATHTLWQVALPGRPAIQGLCAAAGGDLAGRMGVAAASLALAAVSPPQILDGAAVLARSRRHAADLVRRVPQLAAAVSALVDRLAAIHARYPSRHLRPVHGAPHLDQWLEAGGEIGLIDFDRFGLGDPELDAGIVLADLNALDRPALCAARLASAFLAGYASKGVTLRQPLVAAYRSHQQLAKALRASQSVRPDGDRQAETLVAIAAQMLAEAAPV